MEAAAITTPARERGTCVRSVRAGADQGHGNEAHEEFDNSTAWVMTSFYAEWRVAKEMVKIAVR